MLIFRIVLGVVLNPLLALGLWLIDKKQNAVKPRSYYILTFFFGIIYLLIVRKKYQSEPTAARKIIIGAYCVLLAVSIILAGIGLKDNNSAVYYDRYGNSYASSNDVLYYTRDGDEYHYVDDRYLINVGTNETVDQIYCLIDGDGYLYIEDGSDGMVLVENGTRFNWYSQKTKSYYTDIIYVEWNADGNMDIE